MKTLKTFDEFLKMGIIRKQIIYYGQKFDTSYAKETFNLLNKIYPNYK